LFYASPLPSSIPPPLNLHNRQVDDCVADDEEILIEGGQVDELAEEVEEDVGVDLSAGVVCIHNRQVDDCVADDEEILTEGGQMDVLAEEVEEDVGVDLSAGVVCIHNRQVDDCVADEKGILIEGGQVDVLAEEVEEDVGLDLSAGVVCKNMAPTKKITIFRIVVLRCHPTVTAPSIVGAARASTRTSEMS